MDPRSRPLSLGLTFVLLTSALGLSALAAAAPPATLSKDAQGKWSAGETARANRQWIECIENFSDVVALDPKSLDAQLNLGYCQSQLGQWKDASKTYEGALPLASSD